jgi:hypothetical protein
MILFISLQFIKRNSSIGLINLSIKNWHKHKGGASQEMLSILFIGSLICCSLLITTHVGTLRKPTKEGRFAVVTLNARTEHGCLAKHAVIDEADQLMFLQGSVETGKTDAMKPQS